YGSTQEVPLSVPGVLFNEVIDREYDPVSNLHGPRSGVSRLTGYRGGCRWGSWADKLGRHGPQLGVISLGVRELVSGEVVQGREFIAVGQGWRPTSGISGPGAPFKLAKIENLSEVGRG
ncbi:hypothetical protein BHM03_00012195, partial [Ensete ventricosum]